MPRNIPQPDPPTQRSEKARVDDTKTGALRISTVGCDVVRDLDPQALGVTYWLNAADTGKPHPVKIRFVGRRVGVKGKPGEGDRFSVVETIEHVIPGCGRIAVTTRIPNLAAGTWDVTASPVVEPRSRGRSGGSTRTRTPSLPTAAASGTTAYAPIVGVRAPGAHLGAWPALVGLGVVLALVIQALLANRAQLPETSVLILSLVASLVGLVGAKVYYLVEHRGRPRRLAVAGMCIQGFVIGAIGTVIMGAFVVDVPVGQLLDITAPGLLFGMVIGRFGCFFGGCCAGRPTASRWGLWSSDRHIGVRRIPTQLIESLVALLVGLGAFVLMWNTSPTPDGVVFVGSIAAYTLGRQVLFPLRDLPRNTHRGRLVVTIIAGGVLAIDLAVAVLF